MKCTKFFFVCFLIHTSWISTPLLAQGSLQDKIYLENETSIGNVAISDISKKKVKVKNQEGKQIDFKAREILMIFKGNGQFLVFPNKAQEQKDFLAEAQNVAKNDVIVTNSGQYFPAVITKEIDKEIHFNDLTSEGANKRLYTNELAIIIYKSGQHKLYASPSRVSGIIAQLEDEIQEARSQSFEGIASTGNETTPDGASASRQNTDIDTDTGSQEAASMNGGSKSTMEIDPEVYSRKALQKTADLGTYLAIISDRSNSAAEANKAVELAVKLFIDENAQVEVSSKDGRERFKIRAYLNRLKLLKYDKIEISWTDISYVSNLKKGVDGNYYGVITLQQRFRGFIDNKVVYGDVTEKNVEVMVVSYQKETDGGQQELWDVFLSDVGVVVTKYDQ